MAEQIKDARLDRMVTDAHVCPFGLKSVDLLKREGFAVEDHELRSREETYVFKRRHDIETTPQTFIDGKRIGGYDDLRRHFGRSVRDPSKVTYRPVTAVFAMVLLTVLAASYAALGSIRTVRAAEWFIAMSMCIFAILTLRDFESFSNMFLCPMPMSINSARR